MSYFSKFKVGSTSYDVKDALAGKTLSLSGADLSLVKADGTAASTVTLPGAPYKLISYDATNSYFTFNGEKLTRLNCAVGDLIYFDSIPSSATTPISINSGGTNGLILYGRNIKYGGSATSKRNLIQKLSSWFLARIASVSANYVTAYIIACANTAIESNPAYIDRYGFVVSESTNITSSPKIYKGNGEEITVNESHYVGYDDGRFAYALTVPNISAQTGSIEPGPTNAGFFDYIIHVPAYGGNAMTYSYYYDATAGRYKTFANEGIGGGGTILILIGHKNKA